MAKTDRFLGASIFYIEIIPGHIKADKSHSVSLIQLRQGSIIRKQVELPSFIIYHYRPEGKQSDIIILLISTVNF